MFNGNQAEAENSEVADFEFALEKCIFHIRELKVWIRDPLAGLRFHGGMRPN